jgi:hypothetical protein
MASSHWPNAAGCDGPSPRLPRLREAALRASLRISAPTTRCGRSRSLWRNAADTCKVELTWYQATRHSFVGRNLGAGASLDEVSSAIGHGPPAVTKGFYDHFIRKTFSGTPNRRSEALERLTGDRRARRWVLRHTCGPMDDDDCPVGRNLDLIFHIDSNRIRLDEDLPNMRRLEAWEREGRIDIWIGEAASREVVAGPGGNLRRQQTMKLIHTEHHADTEEERVMHARIEQIIFPGGARNENQRRDVEHVFTSWKNGCYFITNDGASKKQPRGVLGVAADLAKLDIHVVTDEQACAIVMARWRERSKVARDWARLTGNPAPDWVLPED